MPMTNDTFHNIIELEKKIHLMLEEERNKAALWIEEQKSALEKESLHQLQQFKDTSCKERQEVITAAEFEATKLIKKTELAAKKLLDCNEDTLNDVLLKHIRKILPEES
jgi:vacuolar-type H+-ATPase subunit H